MLMLDSRYAPQNIRARKGQCFSNFQSREAFFRNVVLIRTPVYETSEKDLWPHVGLAFPLEDPQRTCDAVPVMQSCSTAWIRGSESLRDFPKVHRWGVPDVELESARPVSRPFFSIVLLLCCCACLSQVSGLSG